MTDFLMSRPISNARGHLEEAAIASCLWAYGRLADTRLHDCDALKRYRQRICKARVRLTELMVKEQR